MTLGGCLEAWLIAPCMRNIAVHAFRRLPDVIVHRNFIRPSTALGDRRPRNEASKHPQKCISTPPLEAIGQGCLCTYVYGFQVDVNPLDPSVHLEPFRSENTC